MRIIFQQNIEFHARIINLNWVLGNPNIELAMENIEKDKYK